MDPFNFVWAVDQKGYKIEHVSKPVGLLAAPKPPSIEVVVPLGGPLRYYCPLDEPGLWLRFAETCRNPDGVLPFVNQFGALDPNPISIMAPVETQLAFVPQRMGLRNGALVPPAEPLTSFLSEAEQLWRIGKQIRAGDRVFAAQLFNAVGVARMPLMRMLVIQSSKRPGAFEWRFVPHSLRDVLWYQLAEAIADNRRFLRCRNEECSNWFRLGPHAASEGGKTYTARREFCSDRCRVAAARRKKRVISHA